MKTTATLLFTLLVLAGNLFAQEVTRTAVYFETGSSLLDANDKHCLDSIATIFKQYNDHTVSLRGHTDSVGTDQSNDVLAADRCKAVRVYLLSKNVPATSIAVESFGEHHPVAPNNSDDGRAKNRRVEIKVRRENTLTPPPVAGPASPLPANEGGAEPPYATVALPPGQSSAGGYNFNVITTTAQMEALGLTTMTTDGAPLISNVMLCVSLSDTQSPPAQPVIIRVPATRNPLCRTTEVQYFNSQTDSGDGRIKWMEIFSPEWKLVDENGQEYFEVSIGPGRPDNPCVNMDCRKNYGVNGTLKLTSKKYTITSVSVIYEKANALLTGHEKTKNEWDFKYFRNDSISSPTLKVTATDKKGQEYTVRVSMLDLKKDKAGVFLLPKKVFAKKR